ncbi:MAG: CAP domain-containing protein [Planctomycetota bacterium]|jgi:hypothetical protein
MKRPALLLCVLGATAGVLLLLSGCSDIAQGVSKFRVRITSPDAGTVILVGDSLDFGASIKGGFSPYDVEWDFGGAAAGSTKQNPGLITLDTTGTFTVTVSCSDSLNNTASASVTITVVPLIAEIASPAADVSITLGQAVDFQGTVQGGAAPFTYAWDFDGGAPASAVEDPGLVTFPHARPYTVTFTVTDGNSDVDSDAVRVVVVDPSLPTKAQIKAYWNTVKPTLTAVSYTSDPVLTVNDLADEGQMNPTLVTEGVAWVNFYRWLAGLPDIVTEDVLWRVRCQKGAHVLAMLKINNDPAPNLHDPPVPSGATAFYQSDIYGGAPNLSTNTGGWIACASGNLSRGWGCPPNTPFRTVDWYMADTGIVSLGHRRAVLHPRLSKTSFGTVGDAFVWASVMYTVERPSFSAPVPNFDYVAYPSQGFYPTQCVISTNAMWSFAANSTKYDLDGVTQATVVRHSDSTDLGVTTQLRTPAHGTHMIDFDPGEAVKDETYVVTIHDILDTSTSLRFDYAYAVTFFDLEE